MAASNSVDHIHLRGSRVEYAPPIHKCDLSPANSRAPLSECNGGTAFLPHSFPLRGVKIAHRWLLSNLGPSGGRGSKARRERNSLGRIRNPQPCVTFRKIQYRGPNNDYPPPRTLGDTSFYARCVAYLKVRGLPHTHMTGPLQPNHR